MINPSTCVHQKTVWSFDSDPVTPNAADAVPKSRKARVRPALRADRIVELRNSDLIQWQAGYKDAMVADMRQALQHKANALAKKNASWFVYGTGLNGVGYGVGTQMIPSPLDMFSGDSLLSKFAGKPIASAVSKTKKTKRALDVDTEEKVTPKRTRQAQSGNEIGLGLFDDDQGMMLMEDGSIGMEIGREAPSALPDHPSSVMPWNVSASLNSFQRGASSSQLGRGFGSAGRRPPPASPLVGRGSALPGALEQFSRGRG